jgi:uncharacterized protein YndB with AHSA1/START domain
MRVLKITAIVLALLGALILTAWYIPSTVRVSRVFAAPLDRVWALWESEGEISKWWGPTGYTAPTIRNDFRPGGSFVLCMRSPAGKLFWNAGTYLEIVSRQRIVQSLSFADEQGHPVPGASAPVPGKWPDHVTVITEFRAVSGGTEVSIEERGIPLIVKLLFAGMGWQQQFDKMVTILR